MGFSVTINEMIAILQADADLQAFITSSFPGKVLRVVHVFRPRVEVNISELPIIMLTRPVKQMSVDNTVTGTGDHTVRLYCGFRTEDRDGAQAVLIAFDEAIEKALMKKMTLNGTADFVSPGSTVNDEGYFHPVYFMVKEMHVSKETPWQE